MSQKQEEISFRELIRHLEKMELKNKKFTTDSTSIATKKSFNISQILFNFFRIIKYEIISILYKMDFFR